MAFKIGIVGVGRMGSNMALRLKDCGYQVTAVFDSQSELAEKVASSVGATACRHLDEVTQLAQLIVTVVTDDQAMDRIFKTSGRSLLKNAKGKIFINCATVSPATHLKVEKRARKVGARTLEACMASSITQARQGTLYLMCGGDRRTYKRVEPVLKDLSASMRYIGASGKASEVKALVNMVMNINTAGLAEGLGLGAALGHDLGMLREVFSQTGANSRVLETDGEDMQHRDHDCYFSAAHAAKDSGIALSMAKPAGIPLPLAEATFQQYALMEQWGLGEWDKSGIAEMTFPGRALAKKKAARKRQARKK